MKSARINTSQDTGKQLLTKIWSDHPLGNLENWPDALIHSLRILFNSQAPMFIFWSQEAYCFYNDGYLPILGDLKQQEAMGAKAEVVWAEAWEPIIKPQLRDLFATGKSTWNVDQHIPLLRDGVMAGGYFSNGYSPIYLDNGEVGGALIVAIETTASAQALKDSEAHLRQVAESLPQFVWTCSPDGNVTYLSKQWEDFTGIKQLEQLEWNWLGKVIHPDDQVRVSEHWMGAVKGLYPYDIEYRIRRHDGVYQWFKARASKIQNEKGQVTNWFGTCTDIEDSIQEKIKFEKNVDTSPAILWITEPDGTCTYLSRQWYAYTGQNTEEGLGFGWLNATHPDDKERSEKNFTESNSKCEPFYAEYRLRTHTGDYRWAINAGNPRFDENGKYLGYAGTVFDIHDLKMAEIKTEEASRRILSIIEHAPVIIWSVDSQGTFTMSQGLGLSNINLRPGELVGKNYFDVYKNNSELTDILKKALKGESVQAESLINDRYFKTNYSPIYDPANNIIGVSGISTDITDSKLTEIEVLTERKNIRTLFKETPEFVCILKGPEHLFEFVNEAHIKVLGFSAVGKTVREAQPESTQVHIILDEVYRTGETTNLHEVPITMGSKLRYFDITFSARRDRLGSINGVMILGTEITEQLESKRAIETLARELQEAVVARDEFLSIASHELKTPLTSIRLQLQLIKRLSKKENPPGYTPEKIDDFIDLTDKQTTRITRLVDDMLDVSRIRTGKLETIKEDLNFCELVKECIQRLDQQFINASYQIPDIPRCENTFGHWDRMRIEQVITNLLTNAIRYGNKKPIHVSVDSDDKSVRLTIKDQGIGISEEDKKIIFNRFERAINSNEVSGLGLGLFIAKQIVTAHGGEIWVESEIGKGSSFTVQLPKE